MSNGAHWVLCKEELPPLHERVVVIYKGVLCIGSQVDRDDVEGGKPWVINGMSGGPAWSKMRPTHWLKGLGLP